jgi:hypothetical protein
MRLLQLSTGRDELLDLHPNVTVVTGLDAASRGALVDAVTGLAELRAPSVPGLLEAHGVLFDLDDSLLATLDLSSPGIDPIVQPAQLPSALSVDAQELRRREQRFEEVLSQVATHVAAQAEARAEVEATARELARATDELRRSQAPAVPTDETQDGADLAEDDEPSRVEGRLREIEQLLVVLAPLERAPVADAVTALRATDLTATVASPEAAALAEELDRIESDLAGLPAALREVGEGELVEARSRLDDARQALLEAEHAVRNPELDPAAVVQLEEAHEALLEAIEHAEGRFSGGRARQRVVARRAAEQAVLDRLGFISYSDYMIGYSVVHADPAREAALDLARAALTEAEEEWTRLEAAAQAGLARAALLDRRRSRRERAALMLDVPVAEGSAQGALRSLRRPAPAVLEAEQRLSAALADAGLDLGDEDLDPEELSAMAEAWLEEADQQDERRRALIEERTALQARQGELQGGPAPGPGEAPPAEPERKQALPPDPAVAQAAATAAAGRHAAALTRLEEEDRTVEALDAQGRVAAAEVERLQDLVAGQATDDATPAEALEWYLLARLAAQRMVSVAGSTPLLLDDALRGLEAPELDHLLGRLESMAEAVQVIVISEDPRVAAWAEAAGPVRAAVVRPVAAPAPSAP